MIHYSRARLAFPLHRLSSGEPLPWAGLSSDYLRLTKELFVFTGAVQRTESRARQPGPGEEETLALKPDGRVGWKRRTAFQDTVCLSHNAPVRVEEEPPCAKPSAFPLRCIHCTVCVCAYICICVCMWKRQRWAPTDRVFGPRELTRSQYLSIWR